MRELLRGPRRVSAVWVTERAASEPWLRAAPVRTADADRIERMCGSPGHQGVCADASPYAYAEADELLAAPDPFVLALDGIQDPQNLGAACRTAEAVGAAVVLPQRRSAEVTPAVCKASAGAVEHLAVARVRNLVDFLAQAKAAGSWCYGADGAARVRYDATDFSGGVVLAMGAEGRGLRPRVKAACDELLAIPMRGRIESLNVSAAAAVLLYEILQRKSALDRTP